MSYPTKLVLVCVECGKLSHAPLLGDNFRIAPRHLYRDCKMLLSIVSPPGTGEVIMAPLCVDPCALKVHGKALVDAAIDKVMGGS